MKLKLLFIGVLFFCIELNAQVNKKPLIENFTQASDPTGVNLEATIEATLNTFGDTKYTKLSYHVSWPGVDLMNANYPEGPSDRRSYYAVNGVPYVIMNGIIKGQSTVVTNTNLTNEAANTTPYKITINKSFNSSLQATVDLTVENVTNVAISSADKLYVAMAEETINYSVAPGTNGVTEFKNVVRKMYNASNGQVSTAGLAIGAIAGNSSLTYNFTVDLPDYIKDVKQVSFVAFVQNDNSKEVLQSEKTALTLKTRYVKTDGTNITPNTATSWATASNDLQATINASNIGDEIFVAKGTYKPNRPANNLTAIDATNRDNAFVLKDGVKLYGGFAGTETTLADRDLSLTANKTILSGDFSGDDTVTGSFSSLSITNNEENAYHVIIGANVVERTYLDGFTVSAGNANASNLFLIVNTKKVFKNAGGGMYNSGAKPNISNITFNNNTGEIGGGMYNDTSSASISNTSFTNNLASSRGGGMSNTGSTPTISNTNFNGNKATDGGGIYNYASSPQLNNSSFVSNYVASKGGGMYNVSSISANKFIISNSIFIGNFGDFGGAMYNDSSSPVITNTTFSENNTSVTAGGVLNFSSNPTFSNIILIGNTGGGRSPGMFNSSSLPIINNSIIQGSTDTTNNNIDATGVLTTSVFKDPANGDYSLNPSSLNPVINKGSNSSYEALDGDTGNNSLTTDKDLAGNQRLFDGVATTDTIDLGAYELQQELDVTAPTITNIVPLDDATSVALASDLKITFNENVTKGTGNIKIHDAADDTVVETIDAADTTVTITDATVTINPTVDLAYSNSYYIKIEATAFKDTSDNNFAGISDKITWSFATETNFSPTFISTAITTANENVAYNYNITTDDQDGDDVTVTATTKPSWLTLQNGTVSTFAGSTAGFTDATGTAAKFNHPTGVAIDASGNLYIADRSNHRIRKIDASGKVSTLAGSGVEGFLDDTVAIAQFKSPNEVAVDALGNVYVADEFNHRIRKITSAGVVTTLAGGTYGFLDGTGTQAQFKNPSGVTVDALGNVYVADTFNHRIRKIDINGVVSTLAGNGITGFTDGIGSTAQFNGPVRIAIDTSGNLYVADVFNHSIRKIDVTGMVSTLAGSGVAGFTDGIGNAAQFNNPYGVAIDVSGNVYVADQNNHRIRKIDANGMVSTLAGNGVRDFADGIGTAAQFNIPLGVAVDVSGNVYVADRLNHRIRKITQNTTLTGTPTASDIGTHNVVLEVSDGNGGTSTQNFTITVADVTSPTIVSLVPADNLTGIAVTSDLKITFSETVAKGSGNITIYDAGDDAVVETIDVTLVNVSIANTVVTINPTADLLKSKNYYVQVTASAFKDASDNNFVGILDKTSWSFATVLKTTPTISFADFSKTYGDANFDLTASSNSTGTISYPLCILNYANFNIIDISIKNKFIDILYSC